MSTPIRWNASASRMVAAVARPKWEEVRQGLTFAVLGYVSSAPQSHAAKEFAFACLCCTLVVPGCFGLAYCLGGGESKVLQAAGGSLALLSVLLFSGFLWSVALGHKDEDVARGVGRFAWFVGFLVGGTVGLFLNASSTSPVALWASVALGWSL